MKDTPSAQTLSNTLAVAPDPAPAPKPQSKRPRMTSRTAPRNGAPRYDSRRYYARSYDAPRYGYEPRYGFEQGSRGVRVGAVRPARLLIATTITTQFPERRPPFR